MVLSLSEYPLYEKDENLSCKGNRTFHQITPVKQADTSY